MATSLLSFDSSRSIQLQNGSNESFDHEHPNQNHPHPDHHHHHHQQQQHSVLEHTKRDQVTKLLHAIVTKSFRFGLTNPPLPARIDAFLELHALFHEFLQFQAASCSLGACSQDEKSAASKEQPTVTPFSPPQRQDANNDDVDHQQFRPDSALTFCDGFYLPPPSSFFLFEGGNNSNSFSSSKSSNNNSSHSKMNLPILEWTAFRGFSFAIWINVELLWQQQQLQHETTAKSAGKSTLETAKFWLFRFTNSSSTLGVEACLEWSNQDPDNAIIRIGTCTPSMSASNASSTSASAGGNGSKSGDIKRTQPSTASISNAAATAVPSAAIQGSSDRSKSTPTQQHKEIDENHQKVNSVTNWRFVQKKIPLSSNKWHFVVVSHSLHYVKKSKVTCFVDSELRFQEELVYPVGLVTASKCFLGNNGKNIRAKVSSIAMYEDEVPTEFVNLLYKHGPAQYSFNKFIDLAPSNSVASELISDLKEITSPPPLTTKNAEFFNLHRKHQAIFHFTANEINEHYHELGVEWIREGDVSPNGKWIGFESLVASTSSSSTSSSSSSSLSTSSSASSEVQQRHARLGKAVSKRMLVDINSVWSQRVGVQAVPILLHYLLCGYEKLSNELGRSTLASATLPNNVTSDELAVKMESLMKCCSVILSNLLLHNPYARESFLRKYGFHVTTHVLEKHRQTLETLLSPSTLVFFVEMVRNLLLLQQETAWLLEDLKNQHPLRKSIWISNPLFASAMRGFLLEIFVVWAAPKRASSLQIKTSAIATTAEALTQEENRYKVQSIYLHQLFSLACEIPKAFQDFGIVEVAISIMDRFFKTSNGENGASTPLAGGSRSRPSSPKSASSTGPTTAAATTECDESGPASSFPPRWREQCVHSMMDLIEVCLRNMSVSTQPLQEEEFWLEEKEEASDLLTGTHWMMQSKGVLHVNLENISWSDEADPPKNSTDPNASGSRIQQIQLRFSLLKNIRALLRFLVACEDLSVCLALVQLLRRLALNFLDMKIALISSNALDCVLFLMHHRCAVSTPKKAASSSSTTPTATNINADTSGKPSTEGIDLEWSESEECDTRLFHFQQDQARLMMSCLSLLVLLLNWLESVEGRTVWCGLDEYTRGLWSPTGNAAIPNGPHGNFHWDHMVSFCLDPFYLLGIQHSIIMNDAFVTSSRKESLLFPIVSTDMDRELLNASTQILSVQDPKAVHQLEKQSNQLNAHIRHNRAEVTPSGTVAPTPVNAPPAMISAPTGVTPSDSAANDTSASSSGANDGAAGSSTASVASSWSAWLKSLNTNFGHRLPLSWEMRLAVMKMMSLRSLRNFQLAFQKFCPRPNSLLLQQQEQLFDESVTGLLHLLPLKRLLTYLPKLICFCSSEFRDKMLLDISVQLKTDEDFQIQVLHMKHEWAEAFLELSLASQMQQVAEDTSKSALAKYVSASHRVGKRQRSVSCESTGSLSHRSSTKTGEDLVLDMIVSLLSRALQVSKGNQSFHDLIQGMKMIQLKKEKYYSSLISRSMDATGDDSDSDDERSCDILNAPYDWLSLVFGAVLQRLVRSHNLLTKTFAENLNKVLNLLSETMLLAPFLQTKAMLLVDGLSSLTSFWNPSQVQLLKGLLNVTEMLLDSLHKQHRVALAPAIQVLEQVVPYVPSQYVPQIVGVFEKAFQQELSFASSMRIFETRTPREVLLSCLVCLRRALLIQESNEGSSDALCALRGLTLKIATTGIFVNELNAVGLTMDVLEAMDEQEDVINVLTALAMPINDTEVQMKEEEAEMMPRYPMPKDNMAFFAKITQQFHRHVSSVEASSDTVQPSEDSKQASTGKASGEMDSLLNEHERVLRAALEVEETRMLKCIKEVSHREKKLLEYQRLNKIPQKNQWTKQLWLSQEYEFRSQHQHEAFVDASPIVTRLKSTLEFRMGAHETPPPGRMRRTLQVQIDSVGSCWNGNGGSGDDMVLQGATAFKRQLSEVSSGSASPPRKSVSREESESLLKQVGKALAEKRHGEIQDITTEQLVVSSAEGEISSKTNTNDEDNEDTHTLFPEDDDHSGSKNETSSTTGSDASHEIPNTTAVDPEAKDTTNADKAEKAVLTSNSTFQPEILENRLEKSFEPSPGMGLLPFDRVFATQKCRRVTPEGHIVGTLSLCFKEIIFEPLYPVPSVAFAQRNNSISPKIMDEHAVGIHRCWRWKYKHFVAVFLRRYRLRDSAVEFFLRNGTNHFIDFPHFNKRKRNDWIRLLYSFLPRHIPKQWPGKNGLSAFSTNTAGISTTTTASGGSVIGNENANSTTTAAAAAAAAAASIGLWNSNPTGNAFGNLSSLTKAWQNHQLSNFEYLMVLNTFAGRSFNDLTQYPVFPWVVQDYTSESLDLQNPSTFRDLSKPMGALNEARLQEYWERFEHFDDPVIPKFLYGSHYSTCAGVVLFFLFRLQPFANLHLKMQGGNFDLPDRLFHSIHETWRMCNSQMAEVKELIPEFFMNGNFLQNVNGYDFGSRLTDHAQVADVLLPPWANGDVDVFIRKHREALESDHVSAHLHDWIDLIFGYKQRGQAALKANNVFYYLTYYGLVDLDAIEDPFLKESMELQIAHFGQCPMQLFLSAHPKRHMGKNSPKAMIQAVANRGKNAVTNAASSAAAVAASGVAAVTRLTSGSENEVVATDSTSIISSPTDSAAADSGSNVESVVATSVNSVTEEPPVVPKVKGSAGQVEPVGQLEVLTKPPSGTVLGNSPSHGLSATTPSSSNMLPRPLSVTFREFSPQLQSERDNWTPHVIKPLGKCSVRLVKLLPDRLLSVNELGVIEMYHWKLVPRPDSMDATPQPGLVWGEGFTNDQLEHESSSPSKPQDALIAQPSLAEPTKDRVASSGEPYDPLASPTLPSSTCAWLLEVVRDDSPFEFVPRIPVFEEASTGFFPLAISSSGRLIVSAGAHNGAIHLRQVDVDNGHVVAKASVIGHEDRVTCLALAGMNYGDEEFLLSGGNDGSLVLWRIANANDSFRLPRISSSPIMRLYGHWQRVVHCSINVAVGMVVSCSSQFALVHFLHGNGEVAFAIDAVSCGSPHAKLGQVQVSNEGFVVATMVDEESNDSWIRLYNLQGSCLHQEYLKGQKCSELSLCAEGDLAILTLLPSNLVRLCRLQDFVIVQEYSLPPQIPSMSNTTCTCFGPKEAVILAAFGYDDGSIAIRILPDAALSMSFLSNLRRLLNVNSRLKRVKGTVQQAQQIAMSTLGNAKAVTTTARDIAEEAIGEARSIVKGLFTYFR